MLWSIPIARIAGTVVRIHVTFLLFLVWIGGAQWRLGGQEAALEGVLFMVLLFACVLAPSPLLSAQSPLVMLHCELREDGFSCPQAPTGNMRDLATRYTTRERIAEAEGKLGRLRELLAKPEVLANLPQETMETTWVTNTLVVPEPVEFEQQQQQQQEIQIANDMAQAPQMQQQARNTIESRARSRYMRPRNRPM